MGISFSCVIATNGRPSLTRAIELLGDSGLGEQDEILLALDADSPPSSQIMALADAASPEAHVVVSRSAESGGDWGAAARRPALVRACKSHIIFCDDDDAYCEGAIAGLRWVLEKKPAGPFFCKMLFQGSHILPKRGRIERNNVGGEQLVLPNVKERIGHYGTQSGNPEHSVDFDFIDSCLTKWGRKWGLLNLLLLEHNGLA